MNETSSTPLTFSTVPVARTVPSYINSTLRPTGTDGETVAVRITEGRRELG